MVSHRSTLQVFLQPLRGGKCRDPDDVTFLLQTQQDRKNWQQSFRADHKAKLEGKLCMHI